MKHSKLYAYEALLEKAWGMAPKHRTGDFTPATRAMTDLRHAGPVDHATPQR